MNHQDSQGSRNTFLYTEEKDRPSKGPANQANRTGSIKRTPRKRRLPIGVVIAIDVLAAALILLAFYISTYVLRQNVTGIDLPAPSAMAGAVTTEQTADSSGQPSGIETDDTASAVSESAEPAATDDPSSWRVKFADKFTDGEVVQTENSYQSANVNISIDRYEDNGVVYFVADIYVADLACFKSAFAVTPDELGQHEFVDAIAEENGALLAINGDYCLNNKGFVIRNGKLYDQTNSPADGFVMYYDGSMKAFTADEMDMENIISEGAYQVWTFGPMLLSDGQPMTEFNSPQNVSGPNNPRTAIGYYEPGHYCFVVVDGRQEGYSYPGYTFEQMSQLFYKLGCAEAFNLDGGQSSEMVYQYDGSYDFVNKPYKDGRSTSDILYITDIQGEQP